MRRLCGVILICSIMLLTGCWDHVEITNLASITGMGFDVASEPHLVRVSVQISPPSSGGVAGGGAGGTRLRVITLDVESPSDFLIQLQGQIRRQPFLEHLGYIVFGEEFAREQGIAIAMSGLQGIRELRGSVPAVVCVGPAEELLKARSGIGRTPGEDVQDILSNLHNAPLGATITINEIMTILSNSGKELFLPILELTPLRLESGDEDPATGLGQGDEELQEVYLSRVALFSRDRWVMDLDTAKTQLFVLLSGRVRKGGINFPHPTDPSGFVAVQYEDFRPRFKPTVNGEQVELEIDITVVSQVLEILGEYDLRTMGTGPMKENLEQTVKNLTQEMLQLLQSAGIDSLGVGQTIHRKMPRQWSTLEDRWSEIYPAVPVVVSVESKIISTGLIQQFFRMKD